MIASNAFPQSVVCEKYRAFHASIIIQNVGIRCIIRCNQEDFLVLFTRRTEVYCCYCTYVFPLFILFYSLSVCVSIYLETKFTLLLSCPYSSPSTVIYPHYTYIYCVLFLLHFMVYKALCNDKKYKEFSNVSSI